MNSGMHQILMTINYIMSTASIMVFLFNLVAWKIWRNFPQKIEKLSKSKLEHEHILRNKIPKCLLKPQILWEKKSLITMVLTNSSLVLLEAGECFLGRYYQKSCQTNLRDVGPT
jgi:sugar phosphate permease